ncbi:MAG: hypothetical protein XD60_1420 [Acetothermia bacterium 64_32]|nr:MAG: hypothetical protein XD60_1420 [Acetothermia bacterium 64_32]
MYGDTTSIGMAIDHHRTYSVGSNPPVFFQASDQLISGDALELSPNVG